MFLKSPMNTVLASEGIEAPVKEYFTVHPTAKINVDMLIIKSLRTACYWF